MTFCGVVLLLILSLPECVFLSTEVAAGQKMASAEPLQQTYAEQQSPQQQAAEALAQQQQPQQQQPQQPQQQPTELTELQASQQPRSQQDGEVSEEELKTLFIFNLPTDVRVREVHNLLRFLDGFDFCVLKTLAGANCVAFAAFHSREQALRARDMVDRLQFDPELPNSIIRAELAKRNTKRSREGRSFDLDARRNERPRMDYPSYPPHGPYPYDYPMPAYPPTQAPVCEKLTFPSSIAHYRSIQESTLHAVTIHPVTTRVTIQIIAIGTILRPHSSQATTPLQPPMRDHHPRPPNPSPRCSSGRYPPKQGKMIFVRSFLGVLVFGV